MIKTLEKLWNEYFAEECAVADSNEERELIKKAAEMHKSVSKSLTEEQNKIFEQYIDALYESQSFFAKKAFFKGCEFSVSFLLEAKNK